MPAHRITAWLAAALSCSAFQVRAEQTLGNDALRSEVTGSTVQIDAPLGYKIPMQFREDGTVHGTAGGLAFYLGSATDQGRWWIANGKLCTRWKQWFDQDDNCITIRRQGRDEFAWVNDKGKSGTGRVVERRAVVAASAGPAASKPAPVTDTAGWVAGANIGRETRVVPASPRPAEPQGQPKQPVAGPAVEVSQSVAAAAPAPSKQPVVRSGLGGPVATVKPGNGSTPQALSADGRVKAAAPPSAKPVTSVAKAPPTKGPAAISAVKQEPQRVFRVVNVDDDDELFMRAQPNSGAPIVGAIPPDGRGVRAIGPCQNSWCPVSFEGRTGWAHGAYLVADGR